MRKQRMTHRKMRQQAEKEEKPSEHIGLSSDRNPTRADAVQRLQDERGNAFIQRMMVQREGDAPRANFNPLDPAVMEAATARVVEAQYAPIRRWLSDNLGSLRLSSLGQIISRLRREVPEAARLGNAELESLIQDSAHLGGFVILPDMMPEARQTRPSVAIPEAVKRAFSIATNGVNLVQFPNGRINVSVSGVTAHLAGGRLNVGWAGSVGFEIPVEGFHLGGRLSSNSWELTLSLPGESSVPDLNKLADVFRKAEAAMQHMVRDTTDLPDLTNVAAVRAAIEPNISPVKEAVEALKNIAESAESPISVGIAASGPMPGREAGAGSDRNTPQGVSITATVTFRF